MELGIRVAGRMGCSMGMENIQPKKVAGSGLSGKMVNATGNNFFTVT
jgi:hypothetical protein